MRPLTVSYCDVQTGAARAAYRIHHAIRQQGVDARMAVSRKDSGDWTVRSDYIPGRLIHRTRGPLGARFAKSLRTTSFSVHSPAIFNSAWPEFFNPSEFDIIHLHWVNWGMLSIADIGRIRKPVVWTLHDMWAFCGAEHYTEDLRWRDGYNRGNRPTSERGFDLNRWTWQRKIRQWRRPIPIVAPSAWLADCVRSSALMRHWPVSVIPNAIDTERWKPVDKQVARDLLGLPRDAPLLLFGAFGGAADPRKGFDLLRGALRSLVGEVVGLELVVFGQMAPEKAEDLGFPVHYTGALHDDMSLRLLYSAADAMVISSRQDNLPNTGVEAHACGTPVVAFDVGGLPDIVDHRRTGYLARPFNAEDLARGVKWILDQSDHGQLRRACRQRAVERWSYPVVGRSYKALYEATLARSTA